MKIINVLSVPIYQFVAPKDLQEKVLEHVKTLEFLPEANQSGYSYHDYFHDELFDFFEDAISQVQKIYYKDNLKFPIVDCWVNKYSKLNSLHRHQHANSVICGIYYVTSHESYGGTIFEMSNPWFMGSSFLNSCRIKIDKSSSGSLFGEVAAESGKLILFPPSLIHSMNIIKNMSVKYSVAFNTFASGIIDDSHTAKLTLSPLSLRDRLKQKT